jgi:DNA-directed RNA polymerase specialized sigma24 family protein
VINVARDEARRGIVGADVEQGGSIPVRGEPTDAGFGSLVRQLPERQRLVVFLRYYADLDYRGISVAAGIEVGTVGPTLAAALAALRRLMTEVET